MIVTVTSHKGGVGKCLDAESEVVDPRTGVPRTIEEIVSGEEYGEVFTLVGRERLASAPITTKVDSGVKPCVRFGFSSGRSVTTTLHHPFLMPDGWRPANEIKVGETAALAGRVPAPRETVSMSEGDLDLLALLIAEGNCTTGVVRFSTMDEEMLGRARAGVVRMGLGVKRESQCDYRLVERVDPAPQEPTHDGLCRCGCGESVDPAPRSWKKLGIVAGKPLSYKYGHGGRRSPARAFARRHGLLGTPAGGKTLPESVYRLPQRQLGRFLATLFMCDGYVGKRGPYYYSVSEKLVRQVQHLLLRFGIQSRVRTKKTLYDGRDHSSWELMVYAGYRKPFLDNIPLWGEKSRRLLQLCEGDRNPNVGSPSLPPALRNELKALLEQKEGPGARALAEVGRKARHSCKFRFEFLGHRSGSLAGRPLEAFCEVLDATERFGWLYSAKSEVFWDKITSIEFVGERRVYDLSVEPTRCFVANDVIVHNTVTAVHLAAFFERKFGEGSTVLVDTDPNASALEWSERGRLPFPVVGPDGEPGEEEHVILDSQGRLGGEDLEAAAEDSDLLVVPTTPEALSLNALMLLVEELESLRGNAEYRVLLTMVPWWNRSGANARKALEAEGVPLLKGEVRRREAFQTAALQGVPVYEVNERRARQGWEDYERVGRQVVKFR